MDWRIRAALERRYDGPVPPGAAYSTDFADSYEKQIARRRGLAWADVREAGRECLFHHRALMDTKDARHLALWRSARKRLTRALIVWNVWRNGPFDAAWSGIDPCCPDCHGEGIVER